MATAFALVLASCAQLQTGLDIVKERACDDPLSVRHARAVLFDHLSGKVTGGTITGTAKLGFDCDRDGLPDNLGTWTPPSR